jgi:uncharacterized protein (TIGR02145 family)
LQGDLLTGRVNHQIHKQIEVYAGSMDESFGRTIVSFALDEGSVSEDEVYTDAYERIDFYWTLGPTGGTQQLTITAVSEDNNKPLDGSPLILTAKAIDPQFSQVQDIQGNQYATVKIGDRIWMAENLKTTQLRDGSAIPYFDEEVNYIETKSAAYCWYDNDIDVRETYGALYNGYSIDTKKLCPAGWHVSTKEDWSALIDLIEENGDDSREGFVLKGFEGWGSGGNGIDLYGFTALPGGHGSGNDFFEAGESASIWSYTDLSSEVHEQYTITASSTYMSESNRSKSSFRSVRCVKD